MRQTKLLFLLSTDVEIDGEVYNSRVTGSYYELNTANSVLLGNIFDFTLYYYFDTHCSAFCALVESKIVTKMLVLMITGSRDCSSEFETHR